MAAAVVREAAAAAAAAAAAVAVAATVASVFPVIDSTEVALDSK